MRNDQTGHVEIEGYTKDPITGQIHHTKYEHDTFIPDAADVALVGNKMVLDGKAEKVTITDGAGVIITGWEGGEQNGGAKK